MLKTAWTSSALSARILRVECWDVIEGYSTSVISLALESYLG